METTNEVLPVAGRPGHCQVRETWWSGVRAGVLALAPFAPFGFIVGATLAASEHLGSAAWLTSPLLAAGRAQLVVARLLDGGQPPGLVVLAVVVARAPGEVGSANVFTSGTPIF